MRHDVPPLPILELAPVRFESDDPDEPILLGSAPRMGGTVRMSAAAVRRAGSADFVPLADAPQHAVITPAGIVRTARIDGVLLTERTALVKAPQCAILQWSADDDVELDLAGLGRHRLAAGRTLTHVLPRATDTTAAFRASASDIRRAVDAGPVIEGDVAIADALAWAKARLHMHAPVLSTTLPVTLASLATGQFQRVRHELDHAPPALLPLLAARLAAWSGDPQSLRPLLPRIRDAVAGFSRDDPADGEDAAVRLAGVAAFQRTATDLGEPGFAGELHALARRLRGRLAGTALAPNAAMLVALRATEPVVPSQRASFADPPAESPSGAPPEPTPSNLRIAPAAGEADVAGHAWLTWAALEAGRVAEGLDGWRRLLAEAVVPVRGAWPRRFGEHADDADATALFVATCLHGLLGVEADASRGRLHIRPVIASAPHELTVRNVAFGDAAVSVTIARAAHAIEIRVAQDEGAIPITALLEPRFASRVARTWIDGRPAELDVRTTGAGVAIPVQLVLDETRTFNIELHPED